MADENLIYQVCIRLDKTPWIYWILDTQTLSWIEGYQFQGTANYMCRKLNAPNPRNEN